MPVLSAADAPGIWFVWSTSRVFTWEDGKEKGLKSSHKR
jgi:hypothetical protein